MELKVMQEKKGGCMAWGITCDKKLKADLTPLSCIRLNCARYHGRHDIESLSTIQRGRALRHRPFRCRRTGASQTDVCAWIPHLRRDAVGDARRRPRIGP